MAALVCTPYGVGHGSEGICIGVDIGPHHLLLDCGLRDISDLITVAQPDFVFCSHAHPDHAQGLLKLHGVFPSLPIYSSEVTAELLPLNWLQETVPTFVEGLPWRTPREVATGLSIELWPAGHLPGAACILITYQTDNHRYRIFYTGDYFLSNTRLVDGLPLETLRGLNPDVLIIEGQAGAHRYPHRRQQENTLASQLRAVMADTPDAGGAGLSSPPGAARAPDTAVVFPAPLLGNGQELLMLLRSHYYFTGLPVTLWVDPIIAAGCDAYLDLLPTFPRSVQNFANHQPIFWDDRIFPQVRRLQLDQGDSPIVGSAIVIVHPATPPEQFCRRYEGQWTVFLPEVNDLTQWQSEVNQTTLPYDWLDRFKTATSTGTVQLETYTLTAHCDQSGTAQLIHNLRPRHVFLVHGSLSDLSDLANLETLQTRYQIHIPTQHQSTEVILDANFWQPAPPQEETYEGEVSQIKDAVTISLPTSISKDPRWLAFAETGLVNICWQGDNLILKGLHPSEALSGSTNARLDPISAGQHCEGCRYHDQNICHSPKSPLFKRTVAPDGYCQEFRAKTR